MPVNLGRSRWQPLFSNKVWRLENVNKHSTECTQIFATRGCCGATAVFRTLVTDKDYCLFLCFTLSCFFLSFPLCSLLSACTCAIMVSLPCQCPGTAGKVCNHSLPARDKNHLLCTSCRSKEHNVDDCCSDCHDWDNAMSKQVSDYHTRLTVQRERKDFLPLCLCLYVSFLHQLIIVSSAACSVTFVSSSLTVMAQPFVSHNVYLSGEPTQKLDSSSISKMEMWEQLKKYWSACSCSSKSCVSLSPSDHPGPSFSSQLSCFVREEFSNCSTSPA